MSCQNPGVFRDFAPLFNISFEEIDLHAGDSIPSLDAYQGLWVMGGSMNVWQEDEFPWLKQEKATIREAVVELKMPFFGICLGHQLLAEALGGKVSLAKNFEIGVHQISPTRTGQSHPLLDNLPELPGWTNVHLAEVSTPPNGAVILAKSDHCANQVMQINQTTYSCQFHPEICQNTLADWLEIPGLVEFLNDLMGHKEFEAFKFDMQKHRPNMQISAKQLFHNWVNLAWPDN